VSVRFPLWIPLLALALVPARSAAEERAFVDVYTPYLEERGESEVVLWSQASHGQEGVAGSAWENRLELEHAFSERFTGALYLNWLEARTLTASPHFDGPSLEGIWRMGRAGARGGDAALYLEARTTGDETELEPRVILAHRGPRTLLALNAAGEFEFHKDDEAGEGAGEKQLALTGGVSRTVSRRWSVGVEGRLSQFLAEGERDPRALFLGPTIALSAAGLRWVAAWQPQVTGVPKTRDGLALGDFPRAEYRLAVGADL
jgi:hypothetical protein